MTRRSYSSQRPSFLSPAAVAVIRRRSKQTIGFLTIAVAVPLAALLATYQSTDPSFNTAINDNPQNLLTFPGALLADILLQIFGLASGLLLPVILVIGGLFLLEKPIHSLKLRIVCFVIGLMSATVVLAAIPNRLGWLKSLGWGGATGELIYLHVQQAVGPILGMGVVGCCGMIFLFAYGYSIGIRPQFWFSVIIKFFEGIRWILTYAQRRSIPQERSKEIPVSAKPVSAKEEPSDSYTPIIVPSVLVEENVETEEKEDHIPFSEIDLSETIIQKKTLKSIVVPQGEDYHLPSVDLLDQSSQKNNIKTVSQESLQQSAEQLETVLQEFGVRGEIVLVSPGPVVTLYELKPAAGIKTSRVIGLADDIARSMSALSARIAVIPGRNVIGIELPNTVRETVYMRDLLLSASYCKTSAQLPLILGKDISGQPVVVDMVRMPHLLVAGTTGSGKSVSINTMIMSILFRLTPEKCRFIMIDPKMLELSIYDGIPHLLTPVVTDPKKAVVALKWAVREMENRYRAMAKLGVRNIDGYNARIQDARTSGELLIRRVQTGFDPDSGKPIFENQSLDVEPLPYIIIVVDEMADLMLVAGKEIEAAVQRLAQMARAAGIHLIMATQRPSVDVITGTIKANFPTRISFQVTSKIDSRTILGEQGAEQLLGQGDMLYMAGGGRVMRVHGPFVRDDEVEQVVQFLKLQGEPTYEESITEEEEGSSEGFEEAHAADPLYQQAIDLVCREGKASTSFVQRYLQIGYNRAARIIEKMEKEGIISPANHAGKREVLR